MLKAFRIQNKDGANVVDIIDLHDLSTSMRLSTSTTVAQISTQLLSENRYSSLLLTSREGGSSNTIGVTNYCIMAPSIPTASMPPQAFVRHFKTLSSPGWGICCNKSARGCGIVKGMQFYLFDFKRCACIVVYFKFPKCSQCKNIKTKLINSV